MLAYDAALIEYFNKKAYEPGWETKWHPSVSKKGWSAFQAYVHKHLLGEDCKPRSYEKLHLSDAAREPIHNCDYALELALWGSTPRNIPPSMLHSAGDMQRRFEIGHSIEILLYQYLGVALESYYGSRLEIHELGFEEPVGKWVVPDWQELFQTRVGGTQDVRIVYSLNKEPAVKGTIDLKSTSNAQSKKRTDAKTGRITADANYVRQVRYYVGPQHHSEGGILYINNEHPWRIQYVNISPTADFERLHKRMQKADPLSGGSGIPFTGAHCSDCPFTDVCEAYRRAKQP